MRPSPFDEQISQSQQQKVKYDGQNSHDSQGGADKQKDLKVPFKKQENGAITSGTLHI